ncbi:hypothetical protein ACQEVG_19565 [Streptomyces sp. CA-135486]|uniref:hypothetical protein n=1 Tax=Streptomyces sp. CA-135486 TaxID=3240049 RepID=UPI003D92DC48
MIDDLALLESKSLRTSLATRTEALDRVKALSLLPDGMRVTTARVAAYFEVTVKTLESVVEDPGKNWTPTACRFWQVRDRPSSRGPVGFSRARGQSRSSPAAPS